MEFDNKASDRACFMGQTLSGTALRPDSIATLLDLAEANFEAATIMCHGFYSSESKTARVIQVLPAVVGYAMAAPLAKDASKRERLLNHVFFVDRAYRRSDDKLLSYAVMYARQGHRGSIAQQARKEAGAMQAYFDSDVPVDDVFRQLIREGGFKGMAERTAAIQGSDVASSRPARVSKTIDDCTEGGRPDDYEDHDQDFIQDAPGCATLEHKDEVGDGKSVRCPLMIPSHLLPRCNAMRFDDEAAARVKKVRVQNGTLAFRLIGF